MDNLEQEAHDILGMEIARELLMEKNATEEQFNEIWSRCQGNPWNAPILFDLLKMTGKL